MLSRLKRRAERVKLFELSRIAPLLVIALVFGALMWSGPASQPFESTELAFTDNSPEGLAIVPASCPSDPHATGECDPVATCAVSFSANPIVSGQSSVLTWTSQYANQWVWINNIGYVGSSGSVTVAPSASTDYSCYASGIQGSDGWHSAILTVYQNCTFNGAFVGHGSSVTAYQNSVVPFGSSCTSEPRTCTNGTLSGTYAYSSCSVTPPANCSLDGVTIAHNTTRTFYSTQTAPVGTLCSSVSLSRSCWNGTLSGSGSYLYANCACAAIYYCSGSSIIYRNTSCSDSVHAQCSAQGQYCANGQSSCLYYPPSFNSGAGGSGLSGHLQARPQLARSGDSVRVYWDVSNVYSCTVSGTNGDSWMGLSSGSSGRLSSGITGQVRYTLSCNAYPTQSFTPENATVNVAPSFNEQ